MWAARRGRGARCERQAPTPALPRPPRRRALPRAARRRIRSRARAEREGSGDSTWHTSCGRDAQLNPRAHRGAIQAIPACRAPLARTRLFFRYGDYFGSWCPCQLLFLTGYARCDARPVCRLGRGGDTGLSFDGPARGFPRPGRTDRVRVRRATTQPATTANNETRIRSVARLMRATPGEGSRSCSQTTLDRKSVV